MVTCICWSCESERELGFAEPVLPLCSPECEAEFADVVACLASGGSLQELDLDPRSLLAKQAVDMVLTLQRAKRIEARAWKEWEWEQNRPRKLRPLYPC